jgi:drug/metabolite transporter (DMT)-like permease
MLIFALAAALLYGSADFLGGVAARRASPFAVIAVTMPAGAVIVLAVAVVTTMAHGGSAGGAMTAFGGWGAYAWATAGAVSGAGGLVAFYTGFARAPMSVVAPVSALVSTVLPVGVAIAGGERPGVSVIVGAVVCLAAIVLVSAHSGSGSGSDGAVTGPAAPGSRLLGLVYGSVAGASFGLFFLCMKYAGHSAVLWPVAVQRVTGSVLALVALGVVGAVPLWRRGRRPRPIKHGGVNSGLLGVALASGAIDATANVSYILATRAGAFGLAVVITSLYPGATVLLARFVLRERMRAVQQIGLVLAAAGIVLVTA